MKKKLLISIMLIACMMASTITGCSSNTSTAATSAAASAVSTSSSKAEAKVPDDILKLLADKNKNEAVLENYGYIKTTVARGTGEAAYAYTLYLDKDCVLYESDAHQFYLSRTIPYGNLTYKDSTEEDLTLFFVNEAHDEYINTKYHAIDYAYNENEKITSSSVQDGMFFITTEITDKENIEASAEYYGFDTENLKAKKYSYTIDANTYVITSMLGYFVYSDKEVMYGELTTETSTARDTVIDEPQALKTVLSNSNSSFTLVADKGTSSECTIDVILHTGVQVILPSKYESTFYKDENYTTVPENGIKSGDTLYIRTKTK